MESNDSFKELGLNKEILKVIQELGFKEPSEIQIKAIPLALQGKDIIGGSATGSGKTLAFGASIIENAVQNKGIQALILTPTRELAEQVSKALLNFSKFKQLNVVPVYGGISINPQIEHLKYAEIVVGTPGRILDHLSRNTIDLKNVKFLVLDEADRMLDMGFLDDVERIIRNCPKQRQTMLFSATISADISRLAKNYMKSPVEVSVTSKVDASKMKQIYYDAPSGSKFSLLVHLLKQEKSNKVIVFCNTKRNADFIGKNLKNQGINAISFHGDLSQNRRTMLMDRFHKGEKLVLVCTDVAARGLDVKDISHVYNYDCPKTAVEYTHRIGRTARAGKEGIAVTILSDRDYDNFRRVELDPELKIEKAELPEFEKVFVNVEEKKRNFSSRGSFRNRSFSNSGRRNFRR